MSKEEEKVVNVRIKKSFLPELDKHIRAITPSYKELNRHAWLIEAIYEKYEREKK